MSSQTSHNLFLNLPICISTLISSCFLRAAPLASCIGVDTFYFYMTRQLLPGCGHQCCRSFQRLSGESCQQDGKWFNSEMLTTWTDFLACILATPQEDLTSAYAASAMCQPQNLSPFSFHCRFSAFESVGVCGINNVCFQLG